MMILRTRPGHPPAHGRSTTAERHSARLGTRSLVVLTILAAGAGVLWLSSTSLAREPMRAPLQAGNGNGNTSTTPAAPSTTPPPPAGNPSATMTAPADGSSVAAGTAVTLTARGSSDLVTALQAGTPRSCYFTLGDDANSTATGTLDATTATCTASWTFTYKAAFSVTGWFATASTISYSTPAITVNVTGAASPRCTGAISAGCTYKWAEVYYTSNTAFSGRVCGIDTCQWAASHTSWSQVTGSDYWLNRTGEMASGDTAEAYLCLGTSSADWSTYSSGRNFATLLAQPETSANPLPAGTC